MHHLAVHSVIVALLVLLAATVGSAQTRGTTADITGVIRDQLQGVLPGAIVSITNVATNVVRTTVADERGRYVIPALPPGTYALRVEHEGFSPLALDDITLTLGSTLELDATLEIAGLQESILVAQSAGLESGRAQVSTTISQLQIASLPINGRNFIDFSTIAPGVTTDQTPQQGAARTSGLSLGGQRGRSNNIMVDGLDNNDEVSGGVRATFSQEAVREFQVLVGSYSAEFGKATGGAVNIVTKSGTNQFSGSVFGYLRDEAMNAREYFEKFNSIGERITRPKAPYHQRQSGATVGGPIRRDRTFLFAAFERLSVDAHNFVTISDRDEVLHPFLGTPLGTPVEIIRRAGFEVDTGHVPYAIRANTFLVKADHQFGPANALTVRFNTATTLHENVEPFGGLVARSRAAALDATDHMFAAGHTIVRGNVVNEGRFQVAYRNGLVYALDPACGGRCDGVDQGGPTVDVTGVASVGRHRFTPESRSSVRYQFLDSLSVFKGTHELKIGVDASHIAPRSPGQLPLHFGGRYVFAPLPAIPGVLPAPVSAIQALALGLPAAYVQGYGTPSTTLSYSEIALFVQDHWRLRPSLTLRAGLRYENQLWPSVRYRVTGYPGEYTFPRDNNNIAPRVGLSWVPGPDRKTTIHGAYGVFHANHITGVAGITDIIDGDEGIRTLVLRFPSSLGPWQMPSRRLPEAAAGSFPSLQISIDPRLRSPYAHHVTTGVDRELASGLRLSADVVWVRGFNQLGTIDFNPLVPALGPGRRPADVNGVAGTSASVLQYTSFGETWYRGLTVGLTKHANADSRLQVSYTLSQAEDNSTDFQTAFLPQSNGAGRNPVDPDGRPIGFDAAAEKGPSSQDQRHRLVLSAVWGLPAGFSAASIVTVASGRPFNILAGVDLNQDGDGGAFPSDRARRIPSDEASAVGRNSGTMPVQATVDVRVSRRFRLGPTRSLDALVEAFNLFNRTSFVEINNVFGPGRYPEEPLPGFGLFEKAGPPRQFQLAVRLNF